MINMKILGGLLLAISSIFCALSYRSYQWRKLRTIDGFISLIFHIKGQIDCYARPRSEILGGLSGEICHACNCPRGAETLEDMIEASKMYLDEEPLRLLTSFAIEFGSTFRDEQIRRCDYYISALSEQRKIISSDIKSKCRAGSTIFICAGLGALILLW